MELNTKYIAGIFVLIIAFIGVYVFVYDAKVDLNGDNANYYMLGQALHQGEGYVSINSINKTPNNHFPPGYPFILSLLFWISDSFASVKFLNAIFLLGSIFLSVVLIKEITSKQVALLSIPFLLLNVHFLKFSTMMMTEIPFLFFSLLSFWFFLQAHHQDSNKKVRSYLLAFLFFIISFYIRTLGIAIIASYGLVLLFEWRKKWKILLSYILGFIACYLPWFLRGQGLGGNSYLKQLTMINPYRPEMGEAGFTNLVLRISSNIGRYISREIPDVIFPFRDFSYKEPVAWLEWVSGIIILIILILGVFGLKKYKKLIIGYLVATFSVLLIWPNVWVGIRFVLPMLPFLVMLFLNGIDLIIEFLRKRTKKPIPLWISLILIIPFFSDISYLNLKSKAGYSPKWENYFKLARDLKREGNTELVVSCRKPTLFYLYSGTFTTRYKYTLDDQDFMEDLKTRKVDLVVLEQLGYSSTARYLYPTIQKNPEQFVTVALIPNPDTYLLQFKSKSE